VELAIKKDRDYGEAYLELGVLKLQAKEYKSALDALDKAEPLLPESPLVYLNRARVYLAQGNEALALENALTANQMDITLIFAYRVIGEVYQAQGDIEGSLKPLTTYIQYVENDAFAWMLIARAQMAVNELDDAQDSVEEALALNKNMADAYLIRAEIYLSNGNGQKAWADYRTVQNMDASSFEANLGIGKALMALKYPGDAYMQFERSKAMAKKDSQKAELLYWRALSLDELSEFAAALRDWRALLDMPSEHVRAEWMDHAEKRIKALASPTPTEKPKTSTPTVKPTLTRQPTLTPTPTATRKPTLTATPTPTPKP
jgi:tetratricopeptide (TPR) repeat protein